MPLSKSQGDSLYVSKDKFDAGGYLENAAQVSELENAANWTGITFSAGFGLRAQKAVSALTRYVYECITNGVWVRFSYESTPYFYARAAESGAVLSALESDANWLNGSFTSAVGGSRFGMQHLDANYKYECTPGAIWIRTPRQ